MLSKNTFRYAKSMPQFPHWYTLRKDWRNDADFIKTVLLIRKYGKTEKFWKNEYIYFYMNGYKYWTMGYPVHNCPKTGTILINKAEVVYNSQYDLIAKQYDNLFTDESSIAENKQLMTLIKPTGRILDIGCGTGLFLDYHDHKEYLGIDTSRNMLEILNQKYPNRVTINVSFEDYYGSGFDTVISLFGAASYINPESLDKAKYLLNPSGRIFFMFYRPEYFPLTYKKTGINITYNRVTKDNLKEFNNYLIWEYENI